VGVNRTHDLTQTQPYLIDHLIDDLLFHIFACRVERQIERLGFGTNRMQNQPIYPNLIRNLDRGQNEFHTGLADRFVQTPDINILIRQVRGKTDVVHDCEFMQSLNHLGVQDFSILGSYIQKQLDMPEALFDNVFS